MGLSCKRIDDFIHDGARPRHTVWSATLRHRWALLARSLSPQLVGGRSPWLGIAVVLALLILHRGAAAQSTSEVIAVGQFSAGALTGWESRSFKGETQYSFVNDPEIKATVLRARANASASGHFRKIWIDLARTPYLNWSWKVTGTFAGINENEKAGDDFPARVYVVVERGLMGMNSLSLNYVWASQHPTGSLWPSPFTNQVQLFAINSGPQGLNKWVHHKRDLRTDLRRAFGEDITQIDAVALMTDTDNHGGRTTSFYGDIWFSAQ